MSRVSTLRKLKQTGRESQLFAQGLGMLNARPKKQLAHNGQNVSTDDTWVNVMARRSLWFESTEGSQLGSDAKEMRVRSNHDLTLFVFATNGFASFDRYRLNFATGPWRSLENRKTGQRFVSSVKSQRHESPTRMLPVELLGVRIHGPCPPPTKPRTFWSESDVLRGKLPLTMQR